MLLYVMRVKLEPRHSVFKNCIFWMQKMYEVQSKAILKPWMKSYVTSLAGVADLYQGQKNIKKNKVLAEFVDLQAPLEDNVDAEEMLSIMRRLRSDEGLRMNSLFRFSTLV
jgi:hypothetical protein